MTNMEHIVSHKLGKKVPTPRVRHWKKNTVLSCFFFLFFHAVVGELGFCNACLHVLSLQKLVREETTSFCCVSFVGWFLLMPWLGSCCYKPCVCVAFCAVSASHQVKVRSNTSVLHRCFHEIGYCICDTGVVVCTCNPMCSIYILLFLQHHSSHSFSSFSVLLNYTIIMAYRAMEPS